MRAFDRQNPIVDDLPWTATDTRLQSLSLLPLVAVAFALFSFWPQIPDQVPSHINAAGNVDAWTDKSFIVVFPLGLSALVSTVFSILAHMPHAANYPVQLTPASAPSIYVLTRRVLLGTLFLLNTFIAGLLVVFLLAAFGESYSSYLLWLLFAFAASLGYTLFRFNHHVKRIATQHRASESG